MINFYPVFFKKSRQIITFSLCFSFLLFSMNGYTQCDWEITNVTCNDGGTLFDTNDDFISFDVTALNFPPTGTGFFIPSVGMSAYPGGSFQTSAGTAGNGDVTIVISDFGDNTCTETETVVDPGFCSIPTFDPNIYDPCICLENETATEVGQFSETVGLLSTVFAADNGVPLPSGLTITVNSVGGSPFGNDPASNGSFDAFNVPATGTQSAGVPVTVGTTLLNDMDLDGDGIFDYYVTFVHIASIGYSMDLLISGSPGGAFDGTTDLINNLCTYPCECNSSNGILIPGN